MASASIMPALIERIKEVTRKKNPGVDIMKKPPKDKKPRKRKPKSSGCLAMEIPGASCQWPNCDCGTCS